MQIFEQSLLFFFFFLGGVCHQKNETTRLARKIFGPWNTKRVRANTMRFTVRRYIHCPHISSEPKIDIINNSLSNHSEFHSLGEIEAIEATSSSYAAGRYWADTGLI